MREALAEILAGYGQTVEEADTGARWRAFVQPVLRSRSEEERGTTALGDVDRRRWLYIGPGDRMLERGQRIRWDGRVYRVRESAAVYAAEQVFYCRAVLLRERESVE